MKYLKKFEARKNLDDFIPGYVYFYKFNSTYSLYIGKLPKTIDEKYPYLLMGLYRDGTISGFINSADRSEFDDGIPLYKWLYEKPHMINQVNKWLKQPNIYEPTTQLKQFVDNFINNLYDIDKKTIESLNDSDELGLL